MNLVLTARLGASRWWRTSGHNNYRRRHSETGSNQSAHSESERRKQVRAASRLLSQWAA